MTADQDFPTTPMPGDFGLPATAPLYVDGFPAEAAQTKLAATTPSTTQTGADPQRFWSTPPRKVGEYTYDELYVNLTKPKQINYISLDLPHFPHHFYIFYWNGRDWVSVTTDDGYDVRFYIDGSVPSVIGPTNVLQAHQNPSHYGADHWIHYDTYVKPFTTSKLRFTCTRQFGSTKGGPVDLSGKPAAYSLGIRNLDFGYRVLKKQDIPLTNRDPDIVTERQSFTTVTDLLGSPVELSVRENRASDLLQGRIWKCEPQPVSYAVVNLYVDARDSAGAAQVIDRFYIQPVTSGVKVNLYYSPVGPTTEDFEAIDTPLSFPLTRTAGETNPVVDSDGIVFPDRISYLDVDNQAIQWEPSKPFWIGVEFHPQFDSTEPNDHVIFDVGAFQLMWQNQEWILGFQDGGLVQQPSDFTYNQRMYAAIVYDGAHVYFYMPGLSVTIAPADFSEMTSSLLRFGGETGVSAEEQIVTGNYRLHTFVLKRETAPFTTDDHNNLIVPDTIQAFMDDPTTYVSNPPFPGAATTTRNSLLRFNKTFVTGDLNPYGFVGGPGVAYDGLVWTPINRDFTVNAGFMQFDPVSAAVFKFEFTNLQPQPYEMYTPTTTKVQIFPAQVVEASAPDVNTGATDVGSAGLLTNSDTAGLVRFADSINIPTGTNTQEFLPTEALYSTDPAYAEQLANAGGALFNFQPWQAPATAPRFTGTQQHFYETVDITQNSRVAYFVALAALQMYRVDYATNDDTEMYLESFGDTAHLDPTSLDPGNVIETINGVVNPSFEADVDADGTPDNWTTFVIGSVVNGSVTQSTEQVYVGSYALKIAADTLATGTGNLIGASTVVTGLDWTSTVTVSAFMKITVGSANVRIRTEFYDSSSSMLEATEELITDVGAGWARRHGSFAVPAGTVQAQIYFWLESNDGGAVIAYIDGVQAEAGGITSYTDGDQPGSEWDGPAHASMSRREPVINHPWDWRPGWLSTPIDLADPAVATGVIYPSTRKVRGIQFATQQSAPVQLLKDPDFDDDTLADWSPIGDIAPLELSTDVNTAIGSTVAIQRLSGSLYWDGLETSYESWDAVEGIDPAPYEPTWNDLESIAGTATYGGIRYKATVAPSQAGRLYAAARVYAVGTLSEPLVLQIIDADGAVLAESDRSVPSGRVTEWWTSYTIGEGGEVSTLTWDDIEAENLSYGELELQGEWLNIDTTTEPLGSQVSVQLIQRGVTTDAWYVDNLALFEDAIVWEFTNDGGETWYPVYDIRNDPHGVFIFPEPAQILASTGTQLQWRVTGYRPNLHVANLAIRPWYGSLPLGVPHKEPGMGGPNVNPTDHFPPVTEDPRWQAWHEPIPQDWFFLFRQLLQMNKAYVPVTTGGPADLWLNPHALVPLLPAPSGDGGGDGGGVTIGPEIYEDEYGVDYVDLYGLEAGSVMYTDNYGNGTY